MPARPCRVKASLCAAFRWIAALLVGLFVAAGPARAADRNTLEIASKTGVHVFSVEIADNDKERAKGLMFRKELPEGQGMLFDFQTRPGCRLLDGEYLHLARYDLHSRRWPILRIAENTTPLSTRQIPSGGPVRAVLEVIAGTARKFGIAPGDRVAHPIFSGR